MSRFRSALLAFLLLGAACNNRDVTVAYPAVAQYRPSSTFQAFIPLGLTAQEHAWAMQAVDRHWVQFQADHGTPVKAVRVTVEPKRIRAMTGLDGLGVLGTATPERGTIRVVLGDKCETPDLYHQLYHFHQDLDPYHQDPKWVAVLTAGRAVADGLARQR